MQTNKKKLAWQANTWQALASERAIKQGCQHQLLYRAPLPLPRKIRDYPCLPLPVSIQAGGSSSSHSSCSIPGTGWVRMARKASGR